MTIHHHKPNYECPRCTSIFLPYKQGIECPNCVMKVDSEDIEEYSDVITAIAGSMKMHKSMYGRYCPGAWYTGNIMDHVQGIIYQIFDAMEEEKPENKEQYLADLLEKKFNWGEQQHLKKHIKDIASEVHKLYDDGNFIEIKFSPPMPPTRSKRIKNWFRKFLP